MSQKSDLEEALAFDMRAAGIPEPRRQFRFHPTRRWPFDFAWPDKMLAVEVEGGTWVNGRHTRGKGYEEDCIKEAEAVLLGWRVLRFTGGMIESGEALKYIEMALR